MAAIRIQKILSAAGLGSRRAAEKLILDGRIVIDGKAAILGAKADPTNCEIFFDGKLLALNAKKSNLTLAINKPRGVIVSRQDDRRRRTVFDLLESYPPNLSYAGRLDRDTSGLLILSTDGKLLQYLSHPKFGMQKEYVASLLNPINAQECLQLMEGIDLQDGFARASVAENIGVSENSGLHLFRIVVHEGRNRIVRRMLANFGAEVIRLHRVSMGPITLGRLKSGKTRDLSHREIGEIRRIGKSIDL
jgi:23S rRNA pseudouridine2605 synthase